MRIVLCYPPEYIRPYLPKKTVRKWGEEIKMYPQRNILLSQEGWSVQDNEWLNHCKIHTLSLKPSVLYESLFPTESIWHFIQMFFIKKWNFESVAEGVGLCPHLPGHSSLHSFPVLSPFLPLPASFDPPPSPPHSHWLTSAREHNRFVGGPPPPLTTCNSDPASPTAIKHMNVGSDDPRAA